MSGEAVPDRAAPSGEPSAEHEVERIAAELVGVLGAGWSWPSIVDRFPVGHPAREHWLKAARTLHARGLRATPAEPGASPPEALVEKWAALATSGDGRHPEAAETLSRCASELKGALAARSPAPAGAVTPRFLTDAELGEIAAWVGDNAGSRIAALVARLQVEANTLAQARSPAPAGDGPREDALRAMAQEFVDFYGGPHVTAPWGYWAAKFAGALRGAVSPSPGTNEGAA
jgi:hypothetical protein